MGRFPRSWRLNLEAKVSVKGNPGRDFSGEFRTQRGFNDLFEVFRDALEEQVDDIGVYRELFWNDSLKPEELLFFAKRVSDIFPQIGFETYLWLSSVLDSRLGDIEGTELAFLCLKKASEFDPKSGKPYLIACDLYNVDLRIPTLESLIAFLRSGADTVEDPNPLFEHLSVFYKMAGNDEMFRYYSNKSRS